MNVPGERTQGRNLAIMMAICVAIYLLFYFGVAHSYELEDCKEGCSDAVVREVPARRPYSKENLTAFSYSQPFMPPLQYDYPYPGRYTVTRVNEREIRLVCPSPERGHVVIACAHLNPCHIYMANDAILKAMGWNYDIVLRHELAHCNGWPADHPGIERPTRT